MMYFRQFDLDVVAVEEDIAALQEEDAIAAEEGPATADDMSYFESEHSP